jgi:transcriptional antiterminator RfaH
VARSKPRAERLAAASLEARGLAAFVPEWKRKRRGHPERREPLFPSYLFVRSDGAPDWALRARSAPNVARLLGGVTGPEPVPDSLVGDIRGRCETQVAALFHPGQHVRIAMARYRDLDAIFDCEQPHDRVRVFVQMLHRMVPVIVDAEAVRLPY